MNVRRILIVTLAAFSASAAVSLHAQEQAGDPPSRVARLAILKGNVSLEPAGVDTFSAAELNYPLTAGDRVFADTDALTELQTAGLAVRLGNGADLTVTSLTDFVAQFGLAQGSLRLRTRDLTAPDGSLTTVEIDTPNGAILVQRAGDIRVDSYPQDDTSVVTVTSGLVEISGLGFDQTLGPNQSIRLAGNPVYAERLRLLPPDVLDLFDNARELDRQRSLAISAAYVDPDMIGVADLGQYGDWAQPNGGPEDVGAVWFPRAVPADWTPYHNGHWAWVAPWGWTWVEAEPWGFAPFHYGRWASFDGRWGWVPGPPPSDFPVDGPRRVRPVYSPALVAFVGGPGFSVSLGFGGGPGAGVTAWFPLGPREAYTPWYHASPGYVNRNNVTNIFNRNATEVHNTYINRTTNVYNTNITQVNYVNRPRATTAIAQRDFAAGRAISQSQPVRFDPSQRRALEQAPILPHPLITPARSIAAPQAPARVVPPSEARPVLESRGALANPGSQGAPGRTFPGQGAPGAPTYRQGGTGQQPAPSQTPAAQDPPQTRSLPTPAQDGGRSQIYGARQEQESAQPQTPGNPRPAGQTPAGQPAAGQAPPQRGAFPFQRNHQADPNPTPAPASPVAPVTRPTPMQGQQGVQAQAPAQAPANLRGKPVMMAPIGPAQQAPTLTAKPVPRPPDQPRALVNRTEPPAPQPSFNQQQRAIERTDPGRPLGPQQVENVRNNRPAGPAQQAEPVQHPATTPPPAPGRGAKPQPDPRNPPDPKAPKPQ